VVRTEEGDLDVLRDGAPQYRMWTRPQRLLDFQAGCWWHRTSPDSHFTRSLVCSLTTVDGRISLSGRRLIRTVEGTRHEQELTTDAEVLDAYRRHFGIDLDHVPEVRT
jgi:N-hydroxyarylamine O-acetyltransferase